MPYHALCHYATRHMEIVSAAGSELATWPRNVKQDRGVAGYWMLGQRLGYTGIFFFFFFFRIGR